MTFKHCVFAYVIVMWILARNLKNNRIPDWRVDAWSSSSSESFCWGLWKFLLGFADFLDCVCAMPYLQNSKTTSIFQSWNDYLCLKVSLKGLKSYSKHRSIRGHQQSFLIRFVYFIVFENILGSDLLHTIRKVKFLSKKSILTKP